MIITAKFGKCVKCGCDVTNKRVNWEVGSKEVSCVICPAPAVAAAAATLAAPAKVSAPAPVKAAAPAPVKVETVAIKLRYGFAHAKEISMHLVGKITRETEKAVYFVGNYDAKESVNCLHCGRELTNSNSRIVGYGPICCENLGIDRPNFDKMTAIEIEKLRETITSKTWEGWIPKSCLESKEQKQEKATAPAPVETAPVVSVDPFQTMETETVNAESGINWENTGSGFKTVHTGSHVLETKHGKYGAYRKLRRLDYGKTRKVWEGEGQDIRCLTIDHEGNILNIEPLYVPHPEGLF